MYLQQSGSDQNCWAFLMPLLVKLNCIPEQITYEKHHEKLLHKLIYSESPSSILYANTFHICSYFSQFLTLINDSKNNCE
jgi:hypothetical protein